MTARRHARRLSVVTSLALLALLTLASRASAAHESSNPLHFDAVAGSTADGHGGSNYVKGASDGTEDGSGRGCSTALQVRTSHGGVHRPPRHRGGPGCRRPSARAPPVRPGTHLALMHGLVRELFEHA